MADIPKPNFSNALWASGGAIVAPSNVKIQTGWTAEVPPFQWENWSQNRQDQGIAHILQHGIAVWDALTEYQAGKSYVQASDGLIYLARTTHTNVNPITDTTFVSWTKALSGGKVATQIFSTVGTFTYTPTPGAKTVKFTVQAGGARGGNTTATNSTQISVAPGGGAGAVAIWEGPVGTASGLIVTVGAGGNQVTPAGGTSSVGTLATAGGGAASSDGAAIAPSAGSAVGIPGVGGIFSAGDARSGWGESGVPCFTAENSLSYSGSGGSSRFGGGGRGIQASGAFPGEAAVSRGAGGAGAAANISKAAQLGGNGGAGIVIAEEFF